MTNNLFDAWALITKKGCCFYTTPFGGPSGIRTHMSEDPCFQDRCVYLFRHRQCKFIKNSPHGKDSFVMNISPLFITSNPMRKAEDLPQRHKCGGDYFDMERIIHIFESLKYPCSSNGRATF